MSRPPRAIWYRLDGKTPEPCGMLEGAAQIEGPPDRRIVGRTEVGLVVVSTVFLAIDHCYDGGAPVLFETMIFTLDDDGRPDFTDYQERYCTWDEAEAGHARAVEFVAEALAPAKVTP